MAEPDDPNAAQGESDATDQKNLVHQGFAADKSRPKDRDRHAKRDVHHPDEQNDEPYQSALFVRHFSSLWLFHDRTFRSRRNGILKGEYPG
jgi:hypothetical protein